MKYKVLCPYCHGNQMVAHPGGYAPIYAECASCGKRFILEPERHGVAVYKVEDTPCCSDPDCLETELAASEND